MNTLEEIKSAVSGLVPDATISIDKAERPMSSSWLDIELNNQHLTIESKPSMGFGLYTSDEESYGDRPDEIYRNQDSLVKRVEMILNKHQSTQK